MKNKQKGEKAIHVAIILLTRMDQSNRNFFVV
jgi:hypothetical protein